MITRVRCHKCRNRKIIIHRFWLKRQAYTVEQILYFIRQHYEWYHGLGRS